MKPIDLLVRHIRHLPSDSRCCRVLGYNEKKNGSFTCAGCGKNLEAYEPQEPVFVEFTDQFSVEDVNVDATDIYGSFGAQHEEPEPMTPFECQVAAEWEGRMTTEHREVMNRYWEI